MLQSLCVIPCYWRSVSWLCFVLCVVCDCRLLVSFVVVVCNCGLWVVLVVVEVIVSWCWLFTLLSLGVLVMLVLGCVAVACCRWPGLLWLLELLVVRVLRCCLLVFVAVVCDGLL